MTLSDLKEKLNQAADTIEFQDVMAVINETCIYSPTRFFNGLNDSVVINDAGQNEGSCKIFAFAQLHHFNEQQTLACFGQYYRDDVLQHPDNQDHANIRQFMRTGWSGIKFDQSALTPK